MYIPWIKCKEQIKKNYKTNKKLIRYFILLNLPGVQIKNQFHVPSLIYP